MAGPNCHIGTRSERNSRERSEDVSVLGEKSEGEALRNIINRNWKDFHVKHDNMSDLAVQQEDHSYGFSWKNL